MPSRTLLLLPAFYKQIPFLVRKEQIDALGQKRIQHDYPNTSTRYIEPQGKVPGEFSIDLFFTGLAWKESFRAFKRILEDPSPGILFLPVFGIINNVVAFPASALADQKSVGEISISVKFSETIEKPSPIEVITEEDAFVKGQEIRDLLGLAFTIAFQAASTLNNVITSQIDIISSSIIVAESTGASRELTILKRNLEKQIRSPSGLSNLLLSSEIPIGFLQSVAINTEDDKAFNKFKTIALTGNTLSNSMNDIRNNITPLPSSVIPSIAPTGEINININVWEEETFERKQRNNNRYAIVNTFRIIGLIGMYEQAATKNYTTTEEIDNIEKVLDLYYSEIIENDKSGIIIPDLKADIDQLKGLTEEILKTKRQKSFKIIEINVEKFYSASLLSYELYGEYIKNEAQLNFLSNLIRGLNRSKPAHKFEGTIKVIEIG